MGGLDGQNVVWLFYHADLGVVAMRIAAIGALIAIADVVADLAQAQFVFDIDDSLGQAFGVFAGRAKQMKRDALGGLLADAREPLTFGDQARQWFGKLGHVG